MEELLFAPQLQTDEQLQEMIDRLDDDEFMELGSEYFSLPIREMIVSGVPWFVTASKPDYARGMRILTKERIKRKIGDPETLEMAQALLDKLDELDSKNPQVPDPFEYLAG